MLMVAMVRAEIVGGDALGRGQEPALCWWLPDGASVQQYRARVQYQAYDVTALLPPGRHVLAVLLADGWYRRQVGLPRAADQYGRDLALRAQVEVRTDCPQRERAGWTGDWQVFAPTAAYLYDVLALTRKSLGDVMLDRRADGCDANMSPCPPSEGFDGPLGGLHGSAGWGDAVVSVPWDLYQAY